MRTISQKLVALLAALTLLLTIGLTPTSAAQLVPFKAKAAGSFVFNADNSGLQLTSAGNASFLGAMTSRSEITFTGPPPPARTASRSLNGRP